MTGEVVPPPDSGEVLEFTYSSLSVGDEQIVRATLQEPSQYLSLLSETLPDHELPTRTMTLSMERGEEPESLELRATSEFTPVEIMGEDHGMSWQDALRVELIELYPEAAEREMPHDSESLYIEVAQTFYARIATDAMVDSCTLEIDLVTRERFNKYAGVAIEEDLPEETTDEVTILKEFTSIWLQAHDIVIRNSAYNPSATELALQLSQPKTTRALVAVAPAEMAMPVREMIDEEAHGFNYIGGLTHAKARLQEIAEAFGDIEARSLYGIGPTHFMLYGPPGTGKTTLVEALANKIDAKLTRVSSSDVIEKWVGQSARNLSNIFSDARKNAYPSIIFFDEFEALGGKSESLSSSERQDVLKVFNTEIIKITKSHPNIIIAAATNVDTHEIEPALIRSGRLEPIQAGLPNEDERVDIWASILAKIVFSSHSELAPTDAELSHGDHRFHLYANDINPVSLAATTDGMTGADFEAVLDFARRRCYHHYKTTGNHRQVSQQDLVDGINAIRQR